MLQTKVSSNFSHQGGKSKRGKVIPIMAFSIVLILGLQFASQFIAHQFNYSPSLGSPLFQIGSIRIYGFWKAIVWFSQLSPYYGKHDTVTRVFGFAGYIAAIMLFLSALAMRLLFLKGGISAYQSLHGSAHWAEREDIIKASLLGDKGKENSEGVVVGGWVDSDDKNDIKKLKVLRHNGKEHILVFAPTRSGKGVGLILPTLLGEWKGSTIVLDIKGENWALTAGYRKQLGQEVYKFDPSDPFASTLGTSVTFNPFEEIPFDYDIDYYKNTHTFVGRKETATIQSLVKTISNPTGDTKTDHWSINGENVIVGAITHLLYAGKRNEFCPCLADVIEELTQEQDGYGDIFRKWANYPHLGFDENNAPIVHPVVKSIANTMIPPAKEEKEGSSIVGTSISWLTLYQDPIIANNTRVSSFKIKDLMDKEKPVNLYLVISPTDLVRLKPLVRILITQIINTLAAADRMKDVNGEMVGVYKNRLLLLLDEFPALGRLEGFPEAIGFVAGFGLKCYVITQDISQLYSAYGKDEAISGNCHIQIAYAANKQETAEMLSKLTGTTTVIKESVSESGKRTDMFHNQTSVSMQEVARPLLTPDECRTLPGPKKNSSGNIEIPGDMLIFPSGSPAVYGKQVLYFKDKVLSARSKIKAPQLSDHGVEDIEAKKRTVASIKEILRNENAQIKHLQTKMNKSDTPAAEKERLQDEINSIKEQRTKARPPQSRGLPPHK